MRIHGMVGFGIVLALVTWVTPVFAQDATVHSAVLEYADEVHELRAIDARGADLGEVSFGFEFRQGDSLRTGRNGGAEVRLEPNGSIIRLSPQTTFRFDELQQRAGSGATEFSVYSGKVRVVAARIRGANYSVRTPTVALGVRGTDFVVDVRLGSREAVLVRSGVVEVLNKASRQHITVSAGQWADAFADEFESVEWEEWDDELGEFDEYFDDVEFDDLDVDEVWEDEFYESGFDYFDDWDDLDYSDDFLEDYEWEDDYLDEEYFDDAEWLDDSELDEWYTDDVDDQDDDAKGWNDDSQGDDSWDDSSPDGESWGDDSSDDDWSDDESWDDDSPDDDSAGDDSWDDY